MLLIIINIILITNIIARFCICVVQTCWPCVIYICNSHSPYVLLSLSYEKVITLWWWNYLSILTCCNGKCYITDEYDGIVKVVLNSHNICIVLLTAARWFITSIITVLKAITVFMIPYALTRVTSPLVIIACCIDHKKS